MSVYSSMYIGMSGMISNEHAITAIGDNIANMNTVGFKGSRWQFADMLSHSMVGPAGSYQVGQGAMVTGSQRIFNQGALLGTGVSTDMAIAGPGYYTLKGSIAGVESQFYSRNGQFTMDKEGFLVAPGGFRLQGFPADANGNVKTGLGDLQVGAVVAPPKETTSITMNLNLDAQAEIQTDTFDPLDPEATASFSTSVTTYDSLGNSHQLDVYFVKTGNGEYEYHVLGDAGEIEGGTPGEVQEIADGTLTFNVDGQLDAETQGNTAVQFNGADGQDIVFDFGDALSDGGNGSGSTNFGGDSTVDLLNQDGYAVGQFQFLNILQDGTIEGTFSNGEVLTLGQVALSMFKNESDLKSVGQNMLAQTELSGDPLIGGADSGGRGEIFAGALEQSNVDLTNEFTQMIVSQRGYQAASKIISTADQMLMETLNLKR